MIKEEAERLAKEMKIDITQTVREEWEIKILKVLFDSKLGKKIFFKGGTALRLAYNSPRFSEDLDFNQIKKINENDINIFLKQLTKIYPEIVAISDLKEKFYTILIELKIREKFLPRNFSIKLEISKRKNKRTKPALMILNSPTINYQVLAPVESIEDIFKEKLIALETRKKTRDLFDLWYITQKLKMTMPKKLSNINKKDIKQELYKFLPRNYYSVIKMFEEKYGR